MATPGSVLEKFPLSGKIRQTLRKSKVAGNGADRQVTIAAFLEAAMLLDESNSDPLYAIFVPLAQSGQFAKAGGLVASALRKASPQIPPVSDGLMAAISSATELRSVTGGRDSFIGSRHLLFAILTAPDDLIGVERNALLPKLGVTPQRAAAAAALYCLKWAEPPESPGHWIDTLVIRGIIPQGATKNFDDSIAWLSNFLKRGGSEPRLGVAMLESDDPWSETVRDHANARNEARAFAEMVCARTFVPPLAVGVFGDWGSGKSFFMRLVHDAIAEKAGQDDGKGKKRGAKDAPPFFFRHVVQIRFNAWHYAETNLWASLVDHIFTCLDSWAARHDRADAATTAFDKLATARRLTVEAAEALVESRRDRHRAAEKLKDAQSALAKKRAAAEKKPQLWANAAWAIVAGEPDKQKELQEATKLLGLDETMNGASDLQAAAATMDAELRRFAVMRSGVVRFLAMPVVVGAITAGMIFLPPLVAMITAKVQPGVAAAAAAISSAFAPIVVALGIAANRTRSAAKVVGRFRDRLETEITNEKAKEEQQVSAAQADMARAEEAIGEAEAQLRLTTDRAAEAARDYLAQSGKGRVLSFVRDRVAKGDYAKQLGFVATVRKDFEELSTLMTAAEETPKLKEKLASERKAHRAEVKRLIDKAGKDLEPAERKKLEDTVSDAESTDVAFERIVLYIDDLDRCPANQVVAVLQAIHLLLTFRLFVVFVAVDVRWLKHALHDQYANQIGEAGGVSGVATATDYLEKIFQVPYWVRPMDPLGTMSILADRMGAKPPREDGLEDDPNSPDALLTGGTALSGSALPPGQGGGSKSSAAATAPPPAPTAAKLELTRNEWEWIQELGGAVLDGSPRRTLRFINTYRVIKASLDAHELQNLEQGGYLALATLLSISVGAPQQYGEWRATLTAGGVKAKTLVTRAEKAANAIGAAPELTDGGDVRANYAIWRYRLRSGTAEDLTSHAPLVSRFAFDQPRGAAEAKPAAPAPASHPPQALPA